MVEPPKEDREVFSCMNYFRLPASASVVSYPPLAPFARYIFFGGGGWYTEACSKTETDDPLTGEQRRDQGHGINRTGKGMS